MQFVISNATDYVGLAGNGKPRSVNEISLACVFDSESEAIRFNSGLPTYFENHDFKVVKIKPIKQAKAPVKKFDSVDAYSSQKKEDCEKFVKNASEIIGGFNWMLNSSKMDKGFATESLSICDRKVSDILHMIEFNEMSASDGYKMAKMLKDVLKERRVYKDFIYVSSLISGISMNPSIATSVSNMSERAYSPKEIDTV